MKQSSSNEKYNVLLVTVDSLRADVLGIYSPDCLNENTSPHIDQWAQDGVTFSRAMTQSTHTSPAFLG